MRPAQADTEPEEIFQREILQRHTAPEPTSWATEPGEAHSLAGHSIGDPFLPTRQQPPTGLRGATWHSAPRRSGVPCGLSGVRQQESMR
ncbi:hypothetical protein [Nonomuraea dietziae]|uniref:Uncharacterized protein n=1 Tax=Nonomuraea dietziae TaxID=65515 RepID=A0A7W5YS80_9ACTN|nr:hypothetical protein [Nonomuraea dietziae]